MKSQLLVVFFASVGIAADVCGTSGYDKGTPSSFTTNLSATTPDSCSKLCKADSQCKSFAVGAGICNLYSAAVGTSNLSADNQGSAYPTRSPYYFYDVNCPIAETSPPMAYDKSAPLCGKRGYDRGAPRGVYPRSSSGQTPEQCVAICKTVANCVGFAMVNNQFTRRTTDCVTYTSLKDNFDFNTNGETGNAYYFYEMSCFASQSSSTLASAPATSSTTLSQVSVVATTTAPSSSQSVVPATTTANTAAASTTSAAAAPPLICGSVGWDKGAPQAYSFASGTTPASCAASCKSDSRCKGYVSGTNGDCLLYVSDFANNLSLDPSSQYKFYDAGCNAAAPAATDSSSAAAASPTSTAAAKTCNLAGSEVSGADASMVGAVLKPANGCKAYCQAKSAVSFEQYYEYCICFSKAASAIATADSKSTVIFSDVSC